MKNIIIASKNPVKIEATQAAFTKMFPNEELLLENVEVSSGVSDQPMNDNESYQGALNRSTNAQKAVPRADFWVGLEGGVETKGIEMEAFAWIIIYSKNGVIGKGRTGTFFLPPRVTELIQQGKELGEAADMI
jgi:inosine/xanthosine triphosphatase